MGVKTLRNKLVPTRTLAREGRNRFRRLADGCDPEAGCNAPDIRVLMRAFTVASRKRAPAPRYDALPPSRGRELTSTTSYFAGMTGNVMLDGLSPPA